MGSRKSNWHQASGSNGLLLSSGGYLGKALRHGTLAEQYANEAIARATLVFCTLAGGSSRALTVCLYDKMRQSVTSKAKQSKAKQSKAKQSEVKQSKAKQSKAWINHRIGSARIKTVPSL